MRSSSVGTPVDRLLARIDTRARREVEALRKEGLEPASREGQIFGGVPSVSSFTVRSLDGDRVEVRLRFRSDEGPRASGLQAWGERWPRAGAVGGASELLASLTRGWLAVAGPYLERPELEDPSATLSVAGASRLEIRWKDGSLSLELGGQSIEMKQDAVIVVEVLRSMGDAVACICRDAGNEEIAVAWQEVSSKTDLPPASFVRFGEESDDIAAETAWYAARFEFDIDAYRLAAVGMAVRQAEFATGMNGVEPSRKDWHPGIASTIPAEEVFARAVEVAALYGQTLDDFCDGAVRQRNHDARRIAVFDRTTPSVSSRSIP